jgi:hypothetical protein
MSRGIASLSRWLAALVTAVSVPCILAPTSAAAAGVSVQVAAVTQTVTNAPASQTPATAGCASGDRIVTSTVCSSNDGRAPVTRGK